MNRFIPFNREQQYLLPPSMNDWLPENHLPLEERLAPDAPPPTTDDPVVKMASELKTQKGRALYGRRKCTVEPVFGIIKPVMGFRQFSWSGLQAVSGEWKLVTMAFNLKRMQVLAATGRG